MKRLLVFLCALVFGLVGINGIAHASSWSLDPSGGVDTAGLPAGSQVDVNLYFNYTGDIDQDFIGMELDFQIDLAEVTPKLNLAGKPDIRWHLEDGWGTLGTQIVGNTVSYAGGNLPAWNSWEMGSNLVATISLLTIGTAQPWDATGDFDLLTQTGSKGIMDYWGHIDSFEGDAGPDYGSVPIPSAVWLLGSGLMGLAGIRRKFKKA